MNNKEPTVVGLYRNILTNKNYAISTINGYCMYVQRFISAFNKNPYHLNKTDATTYLLSLEYTSIPHQNAVISSIKKYYKYILNIKNLDIIGLERPRKEKKLPRIIDQYALKSKIESIKNIKSRVIITLGFLVCMRVSEVCNLKISDIDGERKIIHIRQSKGKKDRYFPISDDTLWLLRRYYTKCQPDDYLIRGQYGGRYSETSCQKLYKLHIDKETAFHCLRHSGATAMYDNGTDIYLISKLLGHKHVSTTEIYIHISMNNLHRAKLVG